MKRFKIILLRWFFTIFSFFLVSHIFAETIHVNQSFAQNGQFDPFQTSSPIYSCKLNGTVTLNGDKSLIRVILVTTSGEELLIYEVFPAIYETSALNNVYYETCYLNGTIPDYIKVITLESSIIVSSIFVERSPIQNALQLQEAVKESIEISRVDLINDYIVDNNLIWYAGTNPNLQLSYEQKRHLFEDNAVPNLQGMEYYVGGFFTLGTSVDDPVDSDIIDNFDWRSRHGANNPSSDYFDGDTDNWSGWIPPRFQGQAGSDCYGQAPTITIEALTNLYFNQHLDIDLSQQSLISCYNTVPPGNYGGSTGQASYYTVYQGVVNESCFPYQPDVFPPCANKCTNPNEFIQANLYEWYYGSDNDEFTIKNDIINNGCLIARTYTTWGHAMMLVGYGKVKVGDEIFFVPPMDEEIIVPHGSPYIGQTYWIFEQSWGLWNNETTFIYIIIPPEQLRIHILKEPLSSMNYNIYDIACLDADNDGYYNWGIGDIKPPTCPTCPDERDCDDSNPWLGPFDEEYNCELLCENFIYKSTPYYINSIITFQDTQYFDCDVIVTPGSELIIEGEIGFVEGAKLIVQSNAKLIIDGGKITGTCGNLWRGIEVWGHINQPQHPSYQGWVEIKNGGTIENALFGIRTIHAEDDEYSDGELLDPTSSGGIVFANNARFVNNKTAIRFYSYPQSSMSNFYECEFETNASILSGITPDYFIWIDHISGIDIIDCSFNNTTGTDYLHSGIYARDATFSIEGRCTTPVAPCNQWEYGWFRKLNYAVYVVNTNTIYYPDIRHTDFSLCKRSIYISTTDGARVTSCRFYMPAALSFSTGDYGLYLNNSFSYHIEANQFMGPSSSQLGGIGVYVNNSGTDWNQVYNNSMSYLNYGTIAYGKNRNSNGSLGLCIECNDFDNNKYDIVVNGKPNIGQGIAYNQGYMGANDTLPAGNTFTRNFPQLVYNYMNSNGMGWLNYVYHGNNPSQEKINPDPYYSPLTMSKQESSNTTYNKLFACPSKLETGGGHERDGIETAETQISQKAAQLADLVDGGNTFNLNFDVVTSTPPEASAVYNTLMGESPFLSDTVIKSAIYKENVLPSAMVRDVLVANPQSAKNTEIMEAIDERFDPMPEWMKEQVLQGVNTTGAKEALESELAKWESKRAEHFNNLYQYFRKDTINPQASADSLEILLTEDSRLESKYRLAFINMQQGAWNEGLAVLNSIPTEFELTPSEVSVHQDYISLFNILILLNGNLPVEASTGAIQLELLASSDEHFPGACARNLLYAAGLIEYEEPIILPEEGLKSSEAIGNRSDKNTYKPEVLKVFPNPAGDYFIAEYNADGYIGYVSLIVTNVTGKPVFSRQYLSYRDQVVINSEDWSSGIYHLSLMVNEIIVKSEKVSIK
jgi:hypothetical protein